MLLIGLALSACDHSVPGTYAVPPDGSDARDTLVEKEGDPGVHEGEEDPKAPEIKVKNAADYSETFLSGLKAIKGYGDFELIDSLFLINKTDTVYFPGFPGIGAYLVFTGRKEGLAITLSVKRINYTTIDYKIEIKESGKANRTQTGQADIHPGFFLGAEMDENETTGIAYFVNEFIDSGENDCVTSIRIGEDEGEGLCSLLKNCNGERQDFGLDDFPVLRRK